MLFYVNKCVFVWFIVNLSFNEAKYNIRVTMPSTLWCGNTSPKEIDGAYVQSTWSSLYKNSACIIKFESSDSSFTTKKIKLNLTDVHINDCSKKLKIYFDDNTYGRAAHILDCRSKNPGVVQSTGKFVTLRLEGALKTPDKANIVLTTIKTTSYCSEFKCNNGMCIDEDLECDRVDHCFDGSDEDKLQSGRCLKPLSNDDIESAVRLGMGVVVAIVIGIIVICVLGCVLLICCCVRGRRNKGAVIRAPASQSTTTTTVVAQQQPQTGPVYPPAPGGYPPAPGGYLPPSQPGTYPPPQPQAVYPQQPAAYPQQPAAYPQQPAAYPQQPAAYPQQPAVAPHYAPPAYLDKPYTDSGPYAQGPPQYDQLQQSSAPAPDMITPTAPPKC